MSKNKYIPKNYFAYGGQAQPLGSNQEFVEQPFIPQEQEEEGFDGKGALTGAASGAAMGSTIMPGWGTAIGAVAGGLYGGLKNNFEDGGNLENNGGYGSNNINPTQVTEFGAGGTHEENPIGGIPQGIGANGKPNLVEEGELKVEDPRQPGQSYIISADKSMKITKTLAKEYGLNPKYAGKTVKQAADKILRKNSKREGDTIEENSKNLELTPLLNIHDILTAEKEAKKEAEFTEKLGELEEEYPEYMQALMSMNSTNPEESMQNPTPEQAMQPSPEEMQQMEAMQGGQGMPQQMQGMGMEGMGMPGMRFGGSLSNNYAVGGILSEPKTSKEASLLNANPSEMDDQGRSHFSLMGDYLNATNHFNRRNFSADTNDGVRDISQNMRDYFDHLGVDYNLDDQGRITSDDLWNTYKDTSGRIKYAQEYAKKYGDYKGNIDGVPNQEFYDSFNNILRSNNYSVTGDGNFKNSIVDPLRYLQSGYTDGGGASFGNVDIESVSKPDSGNYSNYRKFGGNINTFNNGGGLPNPYQNSWKDNYGLPTGYLGNSDNQDYSFTPLTNEEKKLQDSPELYLNQTALNAATQLLPAAYNIVGGSRKDDEVKLDKISRQKLEKMKLGQAAIDARRNAAAQRKAIRNSGAGQAAYLSNLGQVQLNHDANMARMHSELRNQNAQINNQQAGMDMQRDQINANINMREQALNKQNEDQRRAMRAAGVSQLGQYAQAQQKDKVGLTYAQMYSPDFRLKYYGPFDNPKKK